MISTSTRLAAAKGNDLWMRVVMLAPSASSAMSTTVLGDTDMTLMRSYFVKPPITVTMTFSEDPMMGMTTDRFTGSATAKLARSPSCCARRHCAKAQNFHNLDIVLANARPLNAVLTRVCAPLRQAGKPALSRPAS